MLDRLIAEYAGCDCFGQAWLEKASAQAALGDHSRRGGVPTAPLPATMRADVLAPEALWQSGLLALRENNQLEAAVDLVAFADAFPASERSPDALYLLGMGAVKNQLFNQASQVLSRLQTGYPEYRWAATGYWLGRSYAADGQTRTSSGPVAGVG